MCDITPELHPRCSIIIYNNIINYINKYNKQIITITLKRDREV